MNIPKMTDEQVNAIYRAWSDVPVASALDLIQMAVAARDAQWQAALAEQDWYAQQREKIVAANAYDAKGTPAAQERPLSDVECWELGKPDSVDRAMAQERAEPVAPAVGEEQQELLRRVRGYVEDAAKRYYDGTDGEAIRKNARSLLLQIDRALLSASPPAPAQPIRDAIALLRTTGHDPKQVIELLLSAQPSPEPSKPEQAEAPDPMNYKGMFLDAVRALAEIDGLLGLPEDGCNDPQVTVSALKDYIAGAKEIAGFRDQWVDAQYATLPPASAAGERVGHHEAYTYDELFQAIAAATKREGGGIGISVQAFRAALATNPQAEQEATPPAQTVQDDSAWAEALHTGLSDLREFAASSYESSTSPGYKLHDLYRMKLDEVLKGAAEARTRGDEVGKPASNSGGAA